MRSDQRQQNQLRPLTITRNYTMHAEGSVLICVGNTRVLCNATVTEGVPRFLQGCKQGWVTAEYSMLPRSTHTRTDREAARGKQGGRTLEIQRLIARSLRAAVDLSLLKDYSITVDCDVIQADGGTRTAAITGGCVALYDAIAKLRNKKLIRGNPFKTWVAATSTGLISDKPALDLDYHEDSTADTDMNVVMNQAGEFIEIQGTAENNSFSQDGLNQMLDLAKSGIAELIQAQISAVVDD